MKYGCHNALLDIVKAKTPNGKRKKREQSSLPISVSLTIFYYRPISTNGFVLAQMEKMKEITTQQKKNFGFKQQCWKRLLKRMMT